jgi:hypothetical protein
VTKAVAIAANAATEATDQGDDKNDDKNESQRHQLLSLANLTYRSLSHAFGALVELGEQVRKPVGNALPDDIIVHGSQTVTDVGSALAVETRLWNVARWSGTHGY